MSIDLGTLNWDLLWQYAVNMLASLSPLISLFIGISFAFTVLLYLRHLLEKRNRDDSWF